MFCINRPYYADIYNVFVYYCFAICVLIELSKLN